MRSDLRTDFIQSLHHGVSLRLTSHVMVVNILSFVLILKKFLSYPHSSLPEQTTQQNSQQPDFQLAGGLEKDKQPNSFLQEHKSSDCAETTHQQQKEELPEREQSSADGSPALSRMSSSHLSSPMSPSASSALSPIEGEGTSCHQCVLVLAATQVIKM